MSSLTIAAYGEGIMYPPTLAPNIVAIQQAGWNTVILGLFHISSTGDIGFNNESIVSGGQYVGDAAWPGQLQTLMAGGSNNGLRMLLASIGGGGVSDFANVQAIYQANGNSFVGTALQTNFRTFHTTFPGIAAIDMDVEEGYDQDSFVAFCQMLIEIGFGITFCPYASWEMDFWTGSLAALNSSHPGAVKWWNLQCYDGGSGNDPATWAQAIATAIPGFDTTGFIVAGDWSRNLAKPQPDPSTWYWQGDCPSAMQSLFASIRGEASVGGGFVWTLDQILGYATDQQSKPDPASCGAVGMSDYVTAITDGLAGAAAMLARASGLPRAFAHHLPRARDALLAFHAELALRVGTRPGAGEWSSPAVRELARLIERDAIVRMYVEEMLVQVRTLPGAPPATVRTVPQLLAALNYITTLAPLYNADPKRRHAFPMSSLFVYMMMTVAGEALFRVASFNDGIRRILKEWCAYLDSPASTSVLNTSPTGWLSPSAVMEYQLDDFVTDRNKPHWGFASYNDFFHRQIKPECRPVSAPDDRKVIVSANDGNVVTIARAVQRTAKFWLKDEPFSLADMLAHSEYVERFVGGDVLQSFLSGANYHRWRAPIDGTVRDRFVVNGLQFSDAESAGWDPNAILSEGYYACVNTRGLVFIESDDPAIGMVCVMPIGITEISSVTIAVEKGQRVRKGEELGYFSYGGSSMCLVFQTGAIREFTVPEPPPKPVVDPTSGPAIRANAAIAIAR